MAKREPTLEELLEDLVATAMKRNREHAGRMYEGLLRIQAQLREPNPNLKYIREIVERAIPRGS